MREKSIKLCRDLNTMIVYRNLLEDKIVQLAVSILEESGGNEDEAGCSYKGYRLLGELLDRVEGKNLSGDIWKNYILGIIIRDENPFSLACEKHELMDRKALYSVALHDFDIIIRLYNLNIFELIDVNPEINLSMDRLNNPSKEKGLAYNEIKALDQILSVSSKPADIVDAFAAFYENYGCGIFSEFSAFRFEKGTGLIGISNIDNIGFEDLIGIEIQKQALINNTEAFLAGRPSNNVLLYGDRGTGKSSSIKALLNEYKERGLRIIEITRHHIDCFYEVLERIKNRGLNFIIFLDDLSFEDFETDYKYLKSVIEGGIEGKPSNMLIYATSNRRHIIRESWKDRENGGDDINTGESLQEKLSLVDRFGETIIFSSPDKGEYLHIVEELAVRHGLEVSVEELRSEALKWEMWHNGRSGRSAQHFINYLMSKRR